MLRPLRTLATAASLSATLVLSAASANAQDAQTCVPGLVPAFLAHQAQYTTLISAVVPSAGTLFTDLNALTDQATYATLLTHSQTLANSITNGRLVITLPDGTVVVDTSKGNNTFANFQAKLINENHNSRVAIYTAQEYPCGIALETKLSTTTGATESYVAVRLGSHLDNLGTARLSSTQ